MTRLLLVAVFLSACNPEVTAKAPASFAIVNDVQDNDAGVAFRALSASGVLYRVRSEKFEPEQATTTLAFWKEATQKKLESDGYVVSDSQDLTLDGLPGASLTALAPIGSVDYAYLIAFAPAGKRMVIAEAAGERAELDKVRAQVLEAIAAIKINR